MLKHGWARENEALLHRLKTAYLNHYQGAQPVEYIIGQCFGDIVFLTAAISQNDLETRHHICINPAFNTELIRWNTGVESLGLSEAVELQVSFCWSLIELHLKVREWGAYLS